MGRAQGRRDSRLIQSCDISRACERLRIWVSGPQPMAYTVDVSSIQALVGSCPPILVDSAALEVVELLASVRAGFPSPAEDLGHKRIDLTAKLIKHPQATFLLRASGDSMREAGIFDGDILVVDKAIRPKSGHIVVAVIDGEFVCKTLWMRAGRVKLKAANPCFPDIVPRDSQTIEVWGVVTSTIKIMPC
jgi:DNA polymerase V